MIKDDVLGESVGQGHRGDHDERTILISMLPGRAGWRIYYGFQDERGGQFVNVADYDAIKDYVLSRRPRSDLLDIYPQLRGHDG